MALRLNQPAFFDQNAVTLARALLGKLLVHERAGVRLVLRITETEAYMGSLDLASHSRGGRMTRRNRIMFEGGGRVYMFLIYGLYHCFNITANAAGHHEAVLIRAGEPVEGIAAMQTNRSGQVGKPAPDKLANGPGKLCQAMALDQSHYGCDLTDEDAVVYLADDGFTVSDDQIQADARVGIDYAGKDRDKPWRFYLKDHPTVSLTRSQRLRRDARREQQQTLRTDPLARDQSNGSPPIKAITEEDDTDEPNTTTGNV